MSQHAHNQMASGSVLHSTKPELSGIKNRKIISGVFEGKSPSDYESAWSPTSPLEFRFFSSLGNPFGASSLRSIPKMHLKSWDSGKVGLSILDSLDDHLVESSRILLPSPDSKNMIFGSLMRTGNPFAKAPIHKEDKPDLVEFDSSFSANAYCSAAGNISVNNDDACQVMKQTQGSLNEDIESDIEISEDYTCVISHGPNPKTTHFYGDQVLESLELDGIKKRCCENKKESIFVIASPDLTMTADVLPPDDFLSFCFSCGKSLGMGKDIYMYRGYKAFCSSECRLDEILLDEQMEEEEDEEEAAKSDSSSDKELSKKKSNGVMFTVG